MEAWPICVNESDQQRRYPDWSPRTMGSWVLSPRALVCTTVVRKWRHEVKRSPASVQKSKAWTEFRGIDASFVLFCDIMALQKKWIWTVCHSDLETHRRQDTNLNLLLHLQSLWFIHEISTDNICLVAFVLNHEDFTRQRLLWIRENLCLLL